VNQRVRREAPHRKRRLVVLHEVLRPDRLACLDVEAVEGAHRAQGVDAVAIHSGSTSRAGGGTVSGAGWVVWRSKVRAGLPVETEDALLAWHAGTLGEAAIGHRLRIGWHQIGDEDLPLRDGRARVAEADRYAPELLRPAFGERLEDAGLAPHAVPLWPKPLRP